MACREALSHRAVTVYILYWLELVGSFCAWYKMSNQEKFGTHFLVFLVSIGLQILKLEVLWCSGFAIDYFIKKIRDICESTGASPPTSRLPPASVVLDNFKPYSTKEVREIIQQSTSCSLDPISTYVLKEFLTFF